MRFIFRADASIDIGTGHTMRCLTLADALVARGSQCAFICRAHLGNIVDLIRSKGYIVHLLPHVSQESVVPNHSNVNSDLDLPHSHWLGTTQGNDADLSVSILERSPADCVIVDHYALDHRWEKRIAASAKKIMVIDDVADRVHYCDLLLDQTLGRSSEDYRSLVPSGCELLCGSNYALLRPEFSELRDYSLGRRKRQDVREVLITMGGVDKNNVTSQVLRALLSSSLPGDCRITVVMGATSPWLNEVEEEARKMPWPTSVRVGVNNMAEIMADSDLAIGAAGATSWERACLGLPTIMLVIADNQRYIADALAKAGAAFVGDAAMIGGLSRLIDEKLRLGAFRQVSASAATVADGLGTSRVVDKLINMVRHEN